MNCQDIRELSSDYLDQRLTPPETSFIEEHLRTCSNCRQEIEVLRTTISLIGSLDPIETSADFLSQVHSKIERRDVVSRIKTWFFKPIKIKVPLEITALLLLGFLASHLYYRSVELPKESGFSAPSESLQIAPDKAVQRGREKRGKEVYERDQSEPKQRSEKAESAASKQKSLDAASEAKSGVIALAPRGAIEEVVADDVVLYGRKVQALLTEMGGRVLLQEGSADSALLLTVELPQSRQAEFVSSLKEVVAGGSKAAKLRPGAASRLKKEAEDKDNLSATERAAEERAASAPEYPSRKDEPMVQFQVRILPKK